jgi:hypothetical protein
MGAELVGTTENTLTIKIRGKLAQTELAAVQKDAAGSLQKGSKKHLLVIADGFQGWEKGDWGDLSVQAALDPYIDRMAIVGDPKWKDLALVFVGKGIRRIQIEYFSPTELADARAWLAK